jgi:hypothetical protein
MKLPGILAVLAPLVFLSCGSTGEIAGASRVIDEYYTAIRENRPAEAAHYFSEDFSRKNPPESWAETTNEIRSEMGGLTDWTKQKGKAHYYPSTVGNEETVVLIYTTRYERHYARELFTLVKDRQTGKYRICGMDITAKGMPEGKK